VAYHALQLMRRDPALPHLDPRVLRRLDPDAIAELPEAAQDVVRRARGERSSLARGGAPSGGNVPPPGAGAELAALVERGDWPEAALVYERTLAGRLFDARSPEADAVLAFLWRTGQWAQAQRLLAERDRLGGDGADLVELRAELSSGKFARPPAGRASAVAAAFALWSSAPDDPEPALDAAAALVPAGSVDRTTTTGRARLLAVLTPYAEPLTILARLRPRIAAHAAAVDRALAALDHGVPGVDPIEGLAARGLLAEWAGAAAFLLHDPDLRVLARSAERWRRTTAGQWSYGRPPRGWDRPLDVTLAARLAALAAAADPVAASQEQLAAWSGDLPVPVADEVRRRLARSLAAAGDVVPVGTDAVAEVLLHRRVPAAFVPPLAVLLAFRALGDRREP
jgi:hypothetical protein